MPSTSVNTYFAHKAKNNKHLLLNNETSIVKNNRFLYLTFSNILSLMTQTLFWTLRAENNFFVNEIYRLDILSCLSLRNYVR